MSDEKKHIEERNKIIAEARAKGEMSLQELAEIYGISRERVRQIAKANGVNNLKASRSFLEHKHQYAEQMAEDSRTAIMMQWLQGTHPTTIAKNLDLHVFAVKSLIDESVTDELLAARSANKVAQHFPEAKAGPINKHEERADRYWTQERCLQALVGLAQSRGGRLPTSTQYKEMAVKDDKLPSFPTVRIRCGRWSEVRVQVHNHIKENY